MRGRGFVTMFQTSPSQSSTEHAMHSSAGASKAKVSDSLRFRHRRFVSFRFLVDSRVTSWYGLWYGMYRHVLMSL
jgi:hypothetical protein